MTRGKYNALEKLTVLEEVSIGEIGFLAAAKNYGINKTTLISLFGLSVYYYDAVHMCGERTFFMNLAMNEIDY